MNVLCDCPHCQPAPLWAQIVCIVIVSTICGLMVAFAIYELIEYLRGR